MVHDGSWMLTRGAFQDWGKSNKEKFFPKNSGEPPLSCQHIGKLPISQSVWLELNTKPEVYSSPPKAERKILSNPEIDETKKIEVTSVNEDPAPSKVWL